MRLPESSCPLQFPSSFFKASTAFEFRGFNSSDFRYDEMARSWAPVMYAQPRLSHALAELGYASTFRSRIRIASFPFLVRSSRRPRLFKRRYDLAIVLPLENQNDVASGIFPLNSGEWSGIVQVAVGTNLMCEAGTEICFLPWMKTTDSALIRTLTESCARATLPPSHLAVTIRTGPSAKLAPESR